MDLGGRHAWEERAAARVSALVRPLPRRFALGLGRVLGRLYAALDRRHVAIAVDNLSAAFPGWDQRRCRQTARAVYVHFAQVLLDLLWLQNRPREEFLRCVRFEGTRHLQAVTAAGRGAVMVTAHTGNWEVHAIAHSVLFGPVGVVARALDNPALDERLCRLRRVGRNEVISKRRALPDILRLLRAGRLVAILIDQNVQARDGIFVDFFGRPAATTTVAPALAVKTGCALVPCHTILEPGGLYRVVYDAPLQWTPSGRRQHDIAALTQRLTHSIEAWVRERPEQWLWMHRRWKTQPGDGRDTRQEPMLDPRPGGSVKP